MTPEIKKTEEIIKNNITYKAYIDSSKDEIIFSLEPSQPTPPFLYKYYGINKNSVEALLNGFLFAAHPFNFNDEYDCSPDLIDYSDCDVNFFIEVLHKQSDCLDEDTIRKFFYSEKDKWQIVRKAADVERDRLWRRFGVISLTEDPISIYMWAHYAQNRGFVVKFNTAKLNKKSGTDHFPYRIAKT
jgi:hypothetical protein